jgi:DtxR family Mn-dependent transcriptional regulator
MASSTEENYLKALYNLANDQGEVSLSDLSMRLQVSLPTANSMVKTLQKSGWVLYEKYRPLTLTQDGKTIAALIIRKHRLTEMFLVKIMNFGWEEVHEVAEQIEHIQAPKFFQRMDQMLGFPIMDPHGSPIPDMEGKITQPTYLALSEVKPGQKVRLEALTNSSTEFLEYLNNKNISLGTQITITSKEIYDKSMVISYLNHPSETLSEMVSKRLLVNIIG